MKSRLVLQVGVLMRRCVTCGVNVQVQFEPCPECGCYEIEGIIGDYYYLIRDGEYVYTENIKNNKKIYYADKTDSYF